MTAADRMAAITKSANFATGMCGDDPLGQDVHWLVRRCKLLQAVADEARKRPWGSGNIGAALDALAESEKDE